MNLQRPPDDDLLAERRAARAKLTAIEAALQAFSASAAELSSLADTPPEEIVAVEDSLEAIRRELARLGAVLGVPTPTPPTASVPPGGNVIPFLLRHRRFP